MGVNLWVLGLVYYVWILGDFFVYIMYLCAGNDALGILRVLFDDLTSIRA